MASPTDPHPRYVVREIAGYSNMGRAAWTTSYWVADSWYCYAVVAEWPSSLTGGSLFDGEGRGRGSNNWNAARRLEAAETCCAELNAEHDAWLAAG